jgi:beta-galactosidase
VAAWQTDNEYGCHDPSISYSDVARDGFCAWLRDVFLGKNNDGDFVTLNRVWGNVFWSMDYDGFEDIDLPNLTVTEVNPAHVLAFRRYSSKKIVEFNRAQVDISSNILTRQSHIIIWGASLILIISKLATT